MQKILKKNSKKGHIILAAIFFFEFILIPLPSLASERQQGVLTEKSDINIEEQVRAIDSSNREKLEKIMGNNEDNINLNNLAISEEFGASTSPGNPFKLPENKEWSIKEMKFRQITAYNSEAGQCDDSPCITANGFNVCKNKAEDTVAANSLTFGTKIRIPELFGNKIFIVRDRMNSRYHDRIDIWMTKKQTALNFGFKISKVEILE